MLLSSGRSLFFFFFAWTEYCEYIPVFHKCPTLTDVFRVGALEAEKAHGHVAIKMDDASGGSQQQVAAQAMLIENLRQDVARLNAENQRLLGFIPKPRRNQLYIISEENTRINNRPSPVVRRTTPSSSTVNNNQIGKLENSNV